MEKILAVILILVFFKLEAQTTNCWVSYDYVLMGDRFNKKGLKLVKGVKATFCFNNGAASFYTKETGLITFSYYDTGSGVDSNYHNQVKWEGSSYPNDLGTSEWSIKMTHNNKVWINNNQKGWAVQLQRIYHSENGKVVFTNK